MADPGDRGPHRDEPLGGVFVWQFCDVRVDESRLSSYGLTVQDVLPPSIHPDTQQPYRWAGRGHWTRLPMVPMQLLDLWRALTEQPEATPSSAPIVRWVIFTGRDSTWRWVRIATVSTIQL